MLPSSFRLYRSVWLVLASTLVASVGLPGCAEHEQQPSAKERFLQSYRPLLRRTGVNPKVANCYVEKLGALPNSFFVRLAAQPSRGRLTLIRLNTRFHKSCVPRGTQVVGSHLSPTAIREARKSLKQNIPVVLRQQGATPPQIRCMVRQVDGLSADELHTLGTSRPGARHLIGTMALHCGGH